MPLKEMRSTDIKRGRQFCCTKLFLLLLLFFWSNKVYAQEASVTFGEESYSVEGETFEIGVLIRADGNIGTYQVNLRYDTGRMEYVSGAESESEGRITLEGTGFGNEVSYILEFRATGGGSAGLAVQDAWIHSAGEEAGYTASTLARVPVMIQGQEDTGAPSFFDQLAAEGQPAASGGEDGTEADAGEDSPGTGIPVTGSITDGDGNVLYLIDMADYEPDMALWDYTLVTGTYLNGDLTYISDQGRNVRVVLTMDENEGFHLYAYKADTHNFYPVSEIEAEGELYYILSAGACMNVPQEITGDEMASGTVFYGINADGAGGYYRYTTSGALEEWKAEKPDTEEQEDGMGDVPGLTRVITAAAVLLLFLILILLFWKKGGIAFLKNRLKATVDYFKDKKQYLFVISELTSREVKRKYARSHLGIIWSVLNPLLMMIVMSMVFSYMFKRSIDNFPLYYLTGSLFWDLFTNGTNNAMSALVDNKSLLVKSKLPKQTFVISRILTALVNMGYSFIPYAVMLVVFRIRPSWTMLFLPLDILLSLVFAMGVGYILSILYVFFADIKYLYGVFIRILLYLTALFYPVTSLPGALQKLIGYNPVYLSIYIARECMVYGRVPHYSAWVKLTLAAAASFAVGWTVYKKKQNDVMQRI